MLIWRMYLCTSSNNFSGKSNECLLVPTQRESARVCNLSIYLMCSGRHTRSQECTDLQSLAKCLDLRTCASDSGCIQAKLSGCAMRWMPKRLPHQILKLWLSRRWQTLSEQQISDHGLFIGSRSVSSLFRRNACVYLRHMQRLTSWTQTTCFSI